MIYNDSLYRISLKCLIVNDEGRVLVVRENGRGSWDLPGGGMDHGEDLHMALARELKEEINFTGNFTFEILAVDDPAKLLTRDVWQVKLVFKVTLDSLEISPGDDAEEVAFIDASILKNSPHLPEQAIYRYVQKL